MTIQIAFLLAVLGVMVYLFMTEKLPVELTAFIGLLVLVFTKYVPVEDAFTGFSSPAVMTMFAIFFISGALLETGVADTIGGRLHSLGRGNETLLTVLVMVVAGVMSAFMNNVAAAAVLLPAIASLARRSGIPPSRLFMPLSFGAILGGTTTLVGTPPNILAAAALEERGIEPFSLFDFTPMGLALLGAGVVYMTTIGKRLLPQRADSHEIEQSSRLTRAYRLEERLTSVRIPEVSKLDGATLRDTRFGTALDAQVVAVERSGRKTVAPSPDFVLRGGDVLLVDGRYEDLQELLRVQGVGVAEAASDALAAVERVRGVVLRLTPGSGLIGRTLRELRFRDRFGVLVVGIRRDGDLLRQHLARQVLAATDELLVLGDDAGLSHLGDQKGMVVAGADVPARDLLGARLFRIRVPGSSKLSGRSIAESRIGELVGLTVLGVARGGETRLVVGPEEILEGGDELFVAGEPTRILELLDLGDLSLEETATQTELESEDIGVVEAIVAPRSGVAGETLRDLDFRGRYGVQVLALWRQGALIDRDVASVPLAFGDALLLHGPHDKIGYLGRGDDFVVLGDAPRSSIRRHKAPVALGALGLMIALVAAGVVPIHVAAFAGAVVTVLFGALTMDEAYRMIEWRALFLVAAVLPVGVAMERSGAAVLLADTVAQVAGPFGPYAFLAALAVLASLLSQGLDGAPTVVILAPVVILAADRLGVDPRPLMMVVGLAASAAFMTPFSHKANLLVMSAGGYKATDYVRVGTPLTIVVLALLVFLVPIFFPL